MFTAEISKEEIFPVIHLKNNETKTTAEIYAFGALLNKFTLKNSINLINGFTSPENAKENITNGFKSAKLSPFVCRLANSKYVFNNDEYIINKFSLGNEAIHGLLFDAVFTVIDSGADSTAAFVTLQYDYSKKNEGFPFAYNCTITYRLESHGNLSIKTTIKNKSDVVIPVCDGWHPYFTIGCKTDEIIFEINATEMIEFNKRLLPTGNIVVYKKFQTPEVIGNAVLDNCFLLNDNNKPACVLRNKQSGLELSIIPGKSYPYLQVYTPEHRNSIAIENLSAAPDAFNNKMGLKLLKPAESISFKTTFVASIKS